MSISEEQITNIVRSIKSPSNNNTLFESNFEDLDSDSDTEEINKENDKIFQPPFNYEQYPWMKQLNLPDFAFRILDHPYLYDEQKHIFVNKFLIRYIEDKEFRKETQDAFIVFVDRFYYDVVYGLRNIMKIGTYKNTKYGIPIFDPNENSSYEISEENFLHIF